MISKKKYIKKWFLFFPPSLIHLCQMRFMGGHVCGVYLLHLPAEQHKVGWYFFSQSQERSVLQELSEHNKHDNGDQEHALQIVPKMLLICQLCTLLPRHKRIVIGFSQSPPNLQCSHDGSYIYRYQHTFTNIWLQKKS